MSPQLTSQLIGLGVFVVLLPLALQRRMRPQPIRPRQLLASAGGIAVVVLGSLAATGGGILSDRPALALVPVFLLAGAGLGYALVRTMTFWVHESGAVWMRGGVAFAAILFGTIALRVLARTALTAEGPPHGFLYDLTADLLFLSLGLWGMRALLIFRRHRQLSAVPERA